MQRSTVDWDTTQAVLRAGTRRKPVSVRAIGADLARQQDTSADDPEVIAAIVRAADELVRNGFIEASFLFDNHSEVRDIKALGRELLE
jgi:hypothetical protein